MRARARRERTFFPIESNAVRISLPYDGGELEVDLPGRSDITIVGDSYPEPLADLGHAFEETLSSPVHSVPLSRHIKKEGSISILVSDMTRGSSIGTVLRLLLSHLERNGAGPDRISIFIATGMHRELGRSDLKHHLGADIFERWDVRQHDATNSDLLIRIGKTSSGTPCYFNEHVVDSTLVITLGTISFHYFAGFGGARKLILPGVAGERTILANHRLSLNEGEIERLSDGCRPGNLEGNPVHEDMIEGAKLLPGALFAVNIVPGAEGGIAYINSGDLEQSHIEACSRYREHYTIPLERSFGTVIVSAGGSPRDVNLLQAHKALRNASFAVSEGGVILAALSCAGGIGSESYAAAFEEGRSGLEKHLRKGYTLNTQTAVSTFDLTEKYSIYLRTMMDDREITPFGFCPWREDYTAYLLEGIPDDEILVIKNASAFLPEPGNNRSVDV
jgi:nickel-dependent lactate racemase